MITWGGALLNWGPRAATPLARLQGRPWSNIILLCYIFQNNELSTGELLMGELVALQKELAGCLVDYVVKPGSEYSII